MHHQQLAIMQQKKGLITIKPYYLPKTRRKAFKTSQSLIDRMSLTSIVTLCHLSLSIMGDMVANGQFVRLQIERSGFKTWPGHCVKVFSKILYSHTAFSTKKYKWVAVNCQGSPQKPPPPPEGSGNTPSPLRLCNKLQQDGPLDSIKSFTLSFLIQ